MTTKKVGRPASGYKTVQVRMDEEAAGLLKRLAAIKGVSIPDLCRQWLVAITREEISVEAKKVAKEFQ